MIVIERQIGDKKLGYNWQPYLKPKRHIYLLRAIHTAFKLAEQTKQAYRVVYGENHSFVRFVYNENRMVVIMSKDFFTTTMNKIDELAWGLQDTQELEIKE